MQKAVHRATTRLNAFLKHNSVHSAASLSSQRIGRSATPFASTLPHRISQFAGPLRLRQPLRIPHSARRHASNKAAPDVTSQLGSPDAQLGLRARLKQLFKQYGYLSVGVYLALSVADFPFCFLAVRLAGPERIGQIEHSVLSTLKELAVPVWDNIEPVVGPAVYAISNTVARIRQGAVNTAGLDTPEALPASGEPVKQSGPAKKSETASIWTQLVLAYGIHKTLLIFVRVPLAVVLTPKVARLLQGWGWRIGKNVK